MNEADKKLREAWEKAGDRSRWYVTHWEHQEDLPGLVELGFAVRAFCESEPEPQRVWTLRQFEGVSADDLRAMLGWVCQRTPNDASPMVVRLQNAAHAYMREIGVPAVAEPEALRKVRDIFSAQTDEYRAKILRVFRAGGDAITDAFADLLESAPVEGGEAKRGRIEFLEQALDLRDVALAQAEKSLAAAEKERDEAKREAEAMRDLANKNANELNAAQRSYRAQIGELTRALEAEKTAHSEALRPDEYTRAAVKFAEQWQGAWGSDGYSLAREQWVVAYKARQRGEPSAEVLAAMHEVCAAAKEWNAVDRELDPVGYARAVSRLMRAVRAMEASRG